MFGRDAEGGALVRTGDPDIDGRRLAEVQHLIDDVGRLEEELQLREAPRQLPAQHRDQLRPSACASW